MSDSGPVQTKRRGRWPSGLGFALLLLLIGLGIIAVDFLGHGAPSGAELQEATITRVTDTSSAGARAGNEGHLVRVAFRLPDGRTGTASAAGGDLGSKSPGDTVNVYRSKDGWGVQMQFSTTMLLVGLAIAGLGALVLVGVIGRVRRHGAGG